MPDPDVKFDFDGSVLGATSAEALIITSAQSDVLPALRDNTAFPTRTLSVGDFSVGAEGSSDIALGRGKAKVSFASDAAIGLLVTPERSVMLEELPVGDPIADGLASEDDEADSSYALLAWRYDLAGAAKGSVALGTGVNVVFGVDAKKLGGFAVVKRFRPDAGARDVLRATVGAWRLPRQVTSPEDLPPGTWLVAEVDGSIALSLGVKAGYDFSWVRDTQLSGLSGDIALRVEAGLSATVGFEASGRYSLVLRRDSLEEADRRLRLQLFKQRKQGWSFALDAQATVQADVSDFALESLDALLRAILGVQGAQLLDDLDAFAEWSDPDKSLGELLAGAGIDRAKELLAEVTGLDVETQLDEARERLVGLLEEWKELDERVASILWSELSDQQAVVAIRSLASEVRDALDERALRELVGKRLGDAGFLATPAGAWLEAIAEGGLLALVSSTAGLQTLRQAAETTLSVLDQGQVETLVGRLKETIERVFGLDRLEGAIRTAVDAADPDQLDAWAKQRLARFLDAQPTVQGLEEILGAMTAIRAKGEDFYQRTLNAIQRQYQLSLAATYRKSVTREALVDLELDFAADGAAQELPELLKEAIDGELNRLFVSSFGGVRLREATLSHQIDRQAHVELSLPWFDRDEKHVARSLAKVSALEDDGGLLLYDGTATDEVSVTTAKARRDSQLTILVDLEERPGLRLHGSGRLTSSYSFQQALEQARTAQVGRQLGGFVKAYFPDEFPADGDGVTTGSFHNWLSALDREVESFERNGLGNLGNTLLSMQVAVGGEVGRAWLEAPEAGHPAYLAMSLRLQNVLKELTPAIYFRDLDRYRPGFVPAAVLFAYAAMPPLTDVRVQGTALVPRKGGGLYWDFQDPNLLAKVLNSEATEQNLRLAAERGRSLLEKIPGMGNRAKDFAQPAGFVRRVRSAVFNNGVVRPPLISLLDADRRIVQGAARAGAAMARFRMKAKKRPEQAVQALSEFGAALSGAFNKSLGNVYLKGALRPFGTLLFAEAAAALDGGLQVESSAYLQLAILKADAPFPPKDFPNHAHPKPEQVLVAQNLVSLMP